jgi:biotin synthase
MRNPDETAPWAAPVRHDWTLSELRDIYNTPLLSLLFRAQQIARAHHRADEVQTCHLVSIKTGGCPEDCSYCPQSAHYRTNVSRQGLMDVDEVMARARRAASEGVTRLCMGAAWRDAPEGPEFDAVLAMVRGVSDLGLEVCCTLGMLTDQQAVRLKQAGLSAYNHNLDTSPEFYGSIITTRVYEERLRTLAAVRRAGIAVCCGGIIGMGESDDDRLGLLLQLARQRPHPESVPINLLQRVAGTPLASETPVDPLILVRMLASARIIMPTSMVRLAAGRDQLSREAEILCFMAGANSIFVGDKLLTTSNPEPGSDKRLFDDLGLTPMPPRPAGAALADGAGSLDA